MLIFSEKIATRCTTETGRRRFIIKTSQKKKSWRNCFWINSSSKSMKKWSVWNAPRKNWRRIHPPSSICAITSILNTKRVRDHRQISFWEVGFRVEKYREKTTQPIYQQENCSNCIKFNRVNNNLIMMLKFNKLTLGILDNTTKKFPLFDFTTFIFE